MTTYSPSPLASIQQASYVVSGSISAVQVHDRDEGRRYKKLCVEQVQDTERNTEWRQSVATDGQETQTTFFTHNNGNG